MVANNFTKKNEAIRLRKKGLSYKQIIRILDIPKSTLSEWVSAIQLTKEQKGKLLNRKIAGLKRAVNFAAKWNREQKAKRLLLAKEGAEKLLNSLNLKDKSLLELALAMLYLGEGTKSKCETSMGNSDPLILKAFVRILIDHYNVSITKIKCGLHLRADQNPGKMKKFWSQELKLPIKNFTYTHIDNRTRGSKTYPEYKGVCLIRCSNVAIQRKLVNISRGFCERIIKRSRA